MHTTDVPLAPEERLREVAAILAAGLLRLRTRPQLAATSDISGGHVSPRESAESAQKALGLPATPRPDPHAG
jgi:hypothetical protein